MDKLLPHAESGSKALTRKTCMGCSLLKLPCCWSPARRLRFFLRAEPPLSRGVHVDLGVGSVPRAMIYTLVSLLITANQSNIFALPTGISPSVNIYGVP